MRDKRIAYWTAVWHKIADDICDPDNKLEITHKMLLKYCCSFTYIPWPGPCNINYYWGGTLGRFFSGRWNSHHGEAVQNAIHKFNCIPFYERGDLITIEYLLALLMEQIGESMIDTDGDLDAILTVIRYQTKVDYYSQGEVLVEDFGLNLPYLAK